MRQVDELAVAEAMDTPFKRIVVASVEGDEIVMWYERKRAIRLTRTEKKVTLTTQGATGEGVSP